MLVCKLFKTWQLHNMFWNLSLTVPFSFDLWIVAGFATTHSNPAFTLIQRISIQYVWLFNMFNWLCSTELSKYLTSALYQYTGTCTISNFSKWSYFRFLSNHFYIAKYPICKNCIRTICYKTFLNCYGWLMQIIFSPLSQILWHEKKWIYCISFLVTD